LARAAALAPDDASVAAALSDARAAAAAAGVDVSSAVEDAAAAVAAAAAELAPADDDLPPLVSADSFGAGGAGGGGVMGPGGAVDPSVVARAREVMRSDPNAMKNMSEAMKNMTEEQLAAMASMTPPGMPKLTPEMARQASAMFENMSADEMDKMMEMASSMRGGMGGMGGMGGAGGAGGVMTPPVMGAGGMPSLPADAMERMQEQMKDPAAMKMVADMMKNMSPETLASMSAAAGMKMSASDAEAMAAAMQSMKPEHMAKLLAVTSAVQGAAAKAKAARAWVARNSMLVAALAVVLLALLLRRYLARRAASASAAEALLRAATASDEVRVPCVVLLAAARGACARALRRTACSCADARARLM
jgi:hypothetical protein